MTKIGRRRFMAYGAGLLVPASLGAARFGPFDWGGGGGVGLAQPVGPTLRGADIPKYRDALRMLPAMPRSGRVRSGGRLVDYYEVAQRQFLQQVLPSGMPSTPVWGYGSVNHPTSFHFPANTFEARVGTPARVKWINDLKRPVSGRYLPHLLPVDPSLHWANPPGGNEGRDSMPSFDSTPQAYTGPVPMVVHLHGSERSSQESDGYPEAWFLPDASNIPSGYARKGSYFDRFRQSSPLGRSWGRGSAVYEYPNEQDPATLWYHDHVLGMTRVNIYAGLAGLYLLRGSEQLPFQEIPLVIQDRVFNADGSLFYPASREFLDGFAGPYIPDSDVPPIWVPGWLGDAMLVNGRTWPYQTVEQRRYRFRILNACNARVLFLQTDADVPLWQIGGDGGFLPAPVRQSRLLLGPAERVDVVVDFSQVPAGTEVTLLNLGPENGPFFGGEPGTDFPPSDPNTTGQVMQFRVVARSGSDDSPAPETLRLPAVSSAAAALGSAATTRQVSLSDLHSPVAPHGHLKGTLGTVNPDRTPQPQSWHSPVTETPQAGATEVWEIHNYTPEVHPVHVHVTQFEVLEREPIGGGAVRGPASGETGRKDTVLAYPGEVTRVRAHFPQAGLFAWHCHLLEHEDNEMMRPLRVDQGVAR